MFASGRWYPQPEALRFYSTIENSSSSLVSNDSKTSISVKKPTPEEFGLPKENAFPVFAKPRGNGKKVFGLVPWKNGEMIADYVLFEESMKLAETSWLDYDGMTRDEREIYIAHLNAVKNRKLSYIDPKTKFSVMTVSKLLHQEKCCGNGCRHCPYGYEMSKHRSRPPTTGIHRRTRLLVVDNSNLGKEANNSGKLAYCIHVYKSGYRKKHMPKAELGDKILVAIRGEMKKGFIVGANTHIHFRKHGVPSTDTNNLVLLDDEGNPLGNRILAPIPATLLQKRDHAQFAKVLALANKFF
uniref:Large ribosomal subunit protein uL14m n=1 Tax=Panagrolaimus superbus TaxID=310955 RepID=A0A914YYE3_9BILA